MSSPENLEIPFDTIDSRIREYGATVMRRLEALGGELEV